MKCSFESFSVVLAFAVIRGATTLVRTQSLALVILFGVAGIANAAGLREYNDASLDASADGNNLTVDDNTGLEWLDLDVTFNKTLSAVTSDNLARPEYAGFSIATTPQLDELFGAFDIAGYSGLSDYYTVPSVSLSDWNSATDLVSKFPLPGTDDELWYALHIMAGWAGDPDALVLDNNGVQVPDTYVAYLEMRWSTQQLRVGGRKSGLADGWDPGDVARNDVGTWLVRPHVIPEPSTFSMLAFCGIAMAGYSRLRRRRK
jgi:hypothetical protein